MEDKARRRIRRYIDTGEPQARVYQIGNRLYEYKVKHHVKSLYFKRTAIMHKLKQVTH
jgi:hypothetical protein